MRRQLGLPVVIDTADRQVLEGTILPHYANRADVQRVLFVGTRWYTQAYEARFAHAYYATLDIDPQAARYGSRQHHVTASASEADRHFEPNSFDLIVFNGVFGWGLNARDDVEAAVRAFARLLRAGGELVVGWNDVPRYRPFPFSEVLALQALQPLYFAPLHTQVLQLETDNRHRFEFFRKPG
ncbi:methyltransferase [Caldimonas brevitalea]|uniref:Methyltransferase n=2 Tax=Caldimonas brevitalea TaxID=413882 RepID=A0A0G3BKE7_9BURK|nr:methyltransferase [Caldimonas brevitalea]